MTRTLRYRAPTSHGAPPIGAILMGTGPRVRRGYRVTAPAVRVPLGAKAMGFTRWRLRVEPMGAAAARADIDAGAPHWGLRWDRRQ